MESLIIAASIVSLVVAVAGVSFYAKQRAKEKVVDLIRQHQQYLVNEINEETQRSPNGIVGHYAHRRNEERAHTIHDLTDLAGEVKEI